MNTIKKTDPVLLKAWKLMQLYAKATGAMVTVLDQELLPIQEVFSEAFSEKNICINYCLKCSDPNARILRGSDMRLNPCNQMHCSAIKGAQRSGGSFIYMCELGFMFWTSPVYSDNRVAGYVLGTGFLGIDIQESVEFMYGTGKGLVPKEELKSRLVLFPRATPERIKALTELLLSCAEYISSGTEDYYETIIQQTEQQSVFTRHMLPKDRTASVSDTVRGYPLDKERMLLAALRRGDNESGRQILNDFLSTLFYYGSGNFKFIQYRAMELVVLLSRAAITTVDTGDMMLEANNRYLRRIQEAKSIEELTDMLQIIVERMSGQIFSFQGVRHASALRKAERFIWENYTRKISLQEIARASGLSAPYFSTIFKEEMGENLSSYLNRMRVEKASYMLRETDLPLSDIAADCGFEDQSWFSKIFKSYTGVSPGKYQGQGGGISEPRFTVHKEKRYG
jgi:AraC-like DNA-binding protein/ligand-binding sensor protein